MDHKPENSDHNNNNNNNQSSSSNSDSATTTNTTTTNDVASVVDDSSKSDVNNAEPVDNVDQGTIPAATTTEEDSEIKQVDEKEPSEETTTEAAAAEEESSDIDSNLPKLSEEVDRFISLISTIVINENDSNSSTALPEIPALLEKFVKLVEIDIVKNDSAKDPSKWLEDSESLFLESVDRISKLTTALGAYYQMDPNYASSVNRTGAVMQRAMSFLEDEFRTFLDDYSKACFDPEQPTGDNSNNKDSKDSKDSKESKDSKAKKQSSFNNKDNQQQDQSSEASSEPSGSTTVEVKFPGYTPEAVSNLHRVAKAMISAGYETECCQNYSFTRRNAFEEGLNKLGFERISIDDVQKMQWESLESEISTWIKAFKRCITVYFPGERTLCETVFSDYPTNSACLFANLTRSVIIQLLNFAEAVAMAKRSAEKLFKFLDMYETLRDLTPAMDEIFSDDSCSELKSEISSARCRLGEAVVSIFCDLENSIKSDTGKTPVPGGAVHPLTRYTMNYLKYACDYKDTLEQVFQEHKKIDQSEAEIETPTSGHNDHNSAALPQTSPFAVQLMSVMDLLDSNLDSKSKLYKDLSLRYIFLMNNGRYIMQKIKGSGEIFNLMGNTWSRKRSSDLRSYHKNYQRETWSKVLDCLKDSGLQVNGKVLKPVLKERFKSFNSMFDEIHKTQSSWIVSDEQLQSELRVSISAVMIPAYRSFLARFSQYLDAGRQTEKYIKYGPDDIETAIDELFDGNPASMIRRR